MFKTISLFILLAPLLAGAAVVTGTLKENEKLIVILNDANVSVVPSSNRQFQISYSDEVLTSTKNSNSTEFRAPEKMTAAKKSPSKVDLIVPAGPLEIHAYDGSIVINRHSGDEIIHLQKGKIILKDTQGQTMLHSQKGEVLTVNHNGKLIIDSYMSAVTVKDLNGDLELQTFAGECTIDKAKGFLNLSIGQGSAKVIASQGSMAFEMGKGSLLSQQFQGRIDGITQDGPVTVALSKDSEVSLKSQSGKVTVQSPPGGGTYVSVVNQEGDIFAPNYLKINRDGGVKILRGRIKGEVQKGSIVVRSQDGPVIIK
jgi:hypothetical protein